MNNTESVAIPLLIIFLVVSFVILLIYDAEHSKWLKENCTVIGETSSDIAPTVNFSSNGPALGVALIDGKTGYHCNDNKTYWE